MKWLVLLVVGVAGVVVWVEPGGVPPSPPLLLEAERGGAGRKAPAPPPGAQPLLLEGPGATRTRARTTAHSNDATRPEAQQFFAQPLEPDAGDEDFMATSSTP